MSRSTRFRDRPDQFALLQEGAGGGDHPFLGADAARYGNAVLHHARNTHRAPRDFILRVHDEHVAAAIVGQHRGLRQHHALRIADGHLGARKRPRAQVLIRFEGDAHHSKAGRRVDDGPEQADPPRIAPGGSGQQDVHRLADLQQRQILFGHLTAQFDFAALRQAKQCLAARARRLADFDVPRQYHAVGRRPHFGARQTRLRFGQLRDGHLHLRGRRHGA